MLGSYLARLGITLAGSMARGRLGPLDTSRLPLRVWPTDVDTYLHLNNGRFLTLMDIGRWDLSVRAGWVHRAMADGWRPVVAAATVRFRRELKAFEPFELVTRIAFWDDRSVYFEHRFERGDVLFAQGFVRAVVKRKGQSMSGPEVMAALGHSGPPPSPPAALGAWIQFLSPARAA